MPYDNKTTALHSAAGFMLTGGDKKFKSFLEKEKCCIVFNLEQRNFIKGQLAELKNDNTKKVKIIVIGDGSTRENLPIAAKIRQVGEILGDEIKSKVSEFRLQVCHQGAQAEKTKKEIAEALKQFNSRYEINFSCPKYFSDIDSNPPTDTNSKTLDEFQSKNFVTGETYTLAVEPFNVKPSSNPNDVKGDGLKIHNRRK